MSQELVPIPSAILDQWLPRLKDTELRLLLIVARQTVGRGGKQADWLSHSQLKVRTGRASEAVSGAVETLIKKKLLVATDAEGIPLSLPEDRRRYRGKAFYRIGVLAIGKSKITQSINTTRPFRFIEPSTTIRTREDIERIEKRKTKIRETLSRAQSRNSTGITVRSESHSS